MISILHRSDPLTRAFSALIQQTSVGKARRWRVGFKWYEENRYKTWRFNLQIKNFSGLTIKRSMFSAPSLDSMTLWHIYDVYLTVSWIWQPGDGLERSKPILCFSFIRHVYFWKLRELLFCYHGSQNYCSSPGLAATISKIGYLLLQIRDMV